MIRKIKQWIKQFFCRPHGPFILESVINRKCGYSRARCACCHKVLYGHVIEGKKTFMYQEGIEYDICARVNRPCKYCGMTFNCHCDYSYKYYGT